MTKPKKGERRVVKAWVMVGPEGFLLVQNKENMDCQIYVDSKGTVKHRDEIRIYPCTISYVLPSFIKNKKK